MKCMVMALIAAILLPGMGQTGPASAPDPFKGLGFLEQTWEANTNGSAGVKASGTYTFRRELGGHVLVRHSSKDPGCKGPAAFDCEHGDVLYVFQEAPGQLLKAIYFDNEGHVIHYDVTTPDAALERAARLCIALGTDGLRGELTLIRAARALAAYDGDKHIEDKHLRRVAPMALSHRLRRNPLDDSGSTTRVNRAVVELFGP